VLAGAWGTSRQYCTRATATHHFMLVALGKLAWDDAMSP
jgi:hypothetical protein